MILSFVMIDTDDMAMGIMLNASLLKICAIIDARTVETVNININDQNYILLVDEDGIANEKSVNTLASLVAKRQIVGRAVAVLTDEFAKLPYDQEQENGTMQ